MSMVSSVDARHGGLNVKVSECRAAHKTSTEKGKGEGSEGTQKRL